MIDRRALRIVVAVVIVVVAVRSISSAAETPSSATTRFDREHVTVERSSTPTPAGSAPQSLSTSHDGVDESTTARAEPPTAGDTAEPADIAELIAATRPTMPDSPIVDDGHHHERTAGRSDEVIASLLMVTAWSWRFDDPPDYTRNDLGSLADAGLIERLAPTPTEIARRGEQGEVAWVIVRNVDTAGSTVTVQFDHHVVSSRNAETITTRQATVTINSGVAVDVQVD